MARKLLLIAKTVWLQSLRRKDVYVVLIFAAFFAIWVTVTRVIGIDSVATADFLTSLGLSVSYVLAAILTAATASRQLPEEFEARTLHPLLARPISRGEVFLGKALGVWSVAVVTLLVLVLITYLPAPKSDEQRLAMLGQAFVLQAMALGLLTVLAMGLSLAAPAAVASLLSLTIFFAGSTVVNFLTLALESIAGDVGRPIARALAIIPDFSMFNQVERFVGGQPAIDWTSLVAMLGYGGGLVAVLYLFAARSFGRRSL